jgi:hypothetical protein
MAWGSGHGSGSANSQAPSRQSHASANQPGARHTGEDIQRFWQLESGHPEEATHGDALATSADHEPTNHHDLFETPGGKTWQIMLHIIRYARAFYHLSHQFSSEQDTS